MLATCTLMITRWSWAHWSCILICPIAELRSCPVTAFIMQSNFLKWLIPIAYMQQLPIEGMNTFSTLTLYTYICPAFKLCYCYNEITIVNELVFMYFGMHLDIGTMLTVLATDSLFWGTSLHWNARFMHARL